VTSFSKKEIIEALAFRGGDQRALHKRACGVRDVTVSNHLYLRGLIEISNICSRDCYYCGIRASSRETPRYELSREETLSCIETVSRCGISSVVLQSGERRNAAWIENLAVTLADIKARYPQICITLSVGELSLDEYRRMYDAGAERYLLRIETSSEKHYRQLHPPVMSFSARLKSIEDMRRAGFQVGSGVMINSPFQTRENLADDLLLLRELDIDMCGMGPYIPHEQSPLAHLPWSRDMALDLGLNMIALLRMAMPDINIAATTALEALSPVGREQGLKAGANVVMPQFSPPARRKEYMLYDNKPVDFEEYDTMMTGLAGAAEEAGMILNPADPGHSLHFRKRKKNGNTC